MIPDIIIPTCKDEFEISPVIGEVSMYCRSNTVIATCAKASAAVNRNKGLDQATSGIVVMMDDDITDLFPGFDQLMIHPLIADPNVIYVSARLLNRDGSPQNAMGAGTNQSKTILDVPSAPSACVAFRNDGTRFDENYVGSGWEDTDFVCQLKKRYPHGRIVINNGCRVCHLNEMKNQQGENFIINRDYYNKKWGTNER